MFLWIKKTFLTLFGSPYFRVTIRLKKDMTTEIDADFNNFFIIKLDQLYSGKEGTWDSSLEDSDKVAIYLYDVIYGVVEPILPEEATSREELLEQEDLDNIPPLAVRGGKEVKQIVDLGNEDKSAGKVNIRLG